MTSTFRDDDLLNKTTLRPEDLRSLNVQDRRFTRERRTYQVVIAIWPMHHEKPTLEVREVAKLLWRDTTSSNDDFTSYRRSIKLIPTTSTTHPVKNETTDSYPKGATLSKFIHEGRPTTSKPTFVALPNLTSHSTFHECSRGIFYQPQYSPHDPLTKLGVIILYFLRLERKIISPSAFIICWNTTTESTPTKLIYSTSKKTTTFQVGIQSSNSLTKST